MNSLNAAVPIENAKPQIENAELGSSSLDAPEAEHPSIRASQLSSGLPVILVTSKYHTRRTRLTWQYVSGGQSQPIVRAASGDPFDPESWWQTRGYVLSVVREYLGLFNYWLGFPVGVGSN